MLSPTGCRAKRFLRFLPHPLDSPGGLCYNRYMPTKQWKKTRHMFTFWVTKKEAAAFRAACKAEGKRQTDVLRATVQILILEHTDAK